MRLIRLDPNRTTSCSTAMRQNLALQSTVSRRHDLARTRSAVGHRVLEPHRTRTARMQVPATLGARAPAARVTRESTRRLAIRIEHDSQCRYRHRSRRDLCTRMPAPARSLLRGRPVAAFPGAIRLVEVVQELSLARDLDCIMAIVRRAARELTGADGATFVLRDRMARNLLQVSSERRRRRIYQRGDCYEHHTLGSIP